MFEEKGRQRREAFVAGPWKRVDGVFVSVLLKTGHLKALADLVDPIGCPFAFGWELEAPLDFDDAADGLLTQQHQRGIDSSAHAFYGYLVDGCLVVPHSVDVSPQTRQSDIQALGAALLFGQTVGVIRQHACAQHPLEAQLNLMNGGVGAADTVVGSPISYEQQVNFNAGGGVCIGHHAMVVEVLSQATLYVAGHGAGDTELEDASGLEPRLALRAHEVIGDGLDDVEGPFVEDFAFLLVCLVIIESNKALHGQEPLTQIGAVFECRLVHYLVVKGCPSCRRKYDFC